MARPLGGLAAAVEQIDAALAAPLWACSSDELVEGLGLLALARHRLAVLERRMVAEAMDRGLPAEAGSSPVDWVVTAQTQSAPGVEVGHAASVLRLAAAQEREVFAPVLSRVDAGEMTPAAADQLVRFYSEVEPVADRAMLADLFTAMIEAASDGLVEVADPADESGETSVSFFARAMTGRQLKLALAQARRMVKPAPDLDDDDERLHRARGLFVRPDVAGMSEYRWVLDPEGAAVVDAALAGLAGPVTAPDGTPDPRTPAQRRSDALLALVRRAVEVPETTMPGQHSAQLVLTMSYEHLVAAQRGAGVSATGQVLCASSVRRLACDAQIVPMLLGSEGEVLDVGRAQRLFTPAQRRVLWQRDRGCTFPGCTAPPAWCEAHHVIHWIRGGRTDVSNGALLCGRHHRYVHSRDLTASVTATGVTWHT